MTRSERIRVAVASLGLQVMTMPCGMVALDVGNILGEEIAYRDIEAALNETEDSAE